MKKLPKLKDLLKEKKKQSNEEMLEAVKRLNAMDDNNEIWFGKDGKSIPSRKTFLCDLKNDGVVPRTIISYSEGGHNHEADEEMKKLA